MLILIINLFIPRGLVLGRLLFLLYIKDMHKCSHILEFHLLADDTNLFHNDSNTLNLETNLNVELEKVIHWLYAREDEVSFAQSSTALRNVTARLVQQTLRTVSIVYMTLLGFVRTFFLFTLIILTILS